MLPRKASMQSIALCQKQQFFASKPKGEHAVIPPQPVPGKLGVGGCWTLWDGWAMTGPGCSWVTWGEAMAGPRYGVGMAALDAGSCVVAYCAGTNCGVGKTPALGEMGRA